MRILKSIKTCIKSIVGYFVFDEYREINNIFLKASSGFSMSNGVSVKIVVENNTPISQPKYYNGSRHRKYCEKYTYFLPYQNPIVKKAIWNMKYRRNTRAINMCADILYDEIVANISERVADEIVQMQITRTISSLYAAKPPIAPIASSYIVYSPSSSFALGQKSYDHMQMVAKSMEKYFDNIQDGFGHTLGRTFANTFAQICHGAILYNKDSGINATQHAQNRSARKLSAKSRFKVSADFIKYLKNTSSAVHQSVHIICLDDVTTTGATFDAIRELLKKELWQNCKIKCEVDCVALCH